MTSVIGIESFQSQTRRRGGRHTGKQLIVQYCATISSENSEGLVKGLSVSVQSVGDTELTGKLGGVQVIEGLTNVTNELCEI